MRKSICLFIVAIGLFSAVQAQHWQLVDPRIGSVGVGRTFPGPSMPFGMVKPGPDCGVLPNAGWAPMPAPVTGFTQTHVSGTGGGQKYGNVLVQPSFLKQRPHEGTSPTLTFDPCEQLREREEILPGLYSTTYQNGITTAITTAGRCAFYRFSYPQPSDRTTVSSLFIDCTHFLGKDPQPNLRERQQFVGASLHVTDSRTVEGFTSVRGGWNNGDAYTVYFCLQSDVPFTAQTDKEGQRAWLSFGSSDEADRQTVQVKIGISYVSTAQARRNIPAHDFDEQLRQLRAAWEQELSKIEIKGTLQQRRMFYTALYHTMLMPVDKTGEYPSGRGKEGGNDTDLPYYDDYYAIWDTYRTSSPLLTLLCPDRQTDIINSLLNIYVREGYMPDARSGDCNGRTQGGSNAEVVIADAFVKGLKGIDYRLALEAMLKDAEVPPADDEKEGRGGLQLYNTLGYIPYGTDRAGTRTIEYAYNDYCIAQVARGLGREDVYEKYMKRSGNWRNLWRTDYEWDGMRGFILPKDKDGRWMDSVPWGRSAVFHPQIPYTPVTKVAPWYLPWWSTFFYEATSEEYSLNIPHDVPGLIEACGGEEKFRERLDLFFRKGYYNVQNEPSFLTPCLYHWIGRPDLSTQRIHQIIRDNYHDGPDGLPGNDDSGAMSSWLAFHMMGLYPNAGHDYYLLTLPVLEKGYTMLLPNGKTLAVELKGKGDVYDHATLNGRRLDGARITHDQLLQGGKLVFYRKKEKSRKIQFNPPVLIRCGEVVNTVKPFFSGEISYTLNRQFRTWPLTMEWDGDTLQVGCKETFYRIPRNTVERTTGFSWLSPQTDGTVYHDVQGTFGFISRKALQQLTEKDVFTYDGITWRKVEMTDSFYHVKADTDGTEMWIARQGDLPLVLEMRSNPLGIDWKIK